MVGLMDLVMCIIQEHLRRFFRGQGHVFDFTSRSALARTFTPRVLENQVDAKKVSADYD